MTEKTYPYTAWALQPSFKPIQVEIVGNYYGEWGKSASGKTFFQPNLRATKEAAIEFGREEVQRMQADLAKRAENLRKKVAALDKASAEPSPAGRTSKND